MPPPQPPSTTQGLQRESRARRRPCIVATHSVPPFHHRSIAVSSHSFLRWHSFPSSIPPAPAPASLIRSFLLAVPPPPYSTTSSSAPNVDASSAMPSDRPSSPNISLPHMPAAAASHPARTPPPCTRAWMPLHAYYGRGTPTIEAPIHDPIPNPASNLPQSAVNLPPNIFPLYIVVSAIKDLTEARPPNHYHSPPIHWSRETLEALRRSSLICSLLQRGESHLMFGTFCFLGMWVHFGCFRGSGKHFALYIFLHLFNVGPQMI
ncbi:hypothetical protein ZEAMMB73_Zm00001d028748 [Zea mays]|uniref:Uncharacterized protein n=1 Tax=Zea mays TaxID=4577 RepID=B4FZG1_MAIZE|nr:unknown [Zea mays]ONL96911.1 hypothetical protein ZEAMMB73_Zm00001d028748 [Zea mays]ONL96912.1 hypothetical protein ZEAMMB73_Zm00001d028748 [Zea mays]ONL96914.1 hypothetical protein ZEAMMB73_Zm00001d028748 [Zea mays]ONL96918.1 hypothetical protein ZEAMMB73_Zm00001d028748 [Zea mays]|eukprot:NP_001142029.1 uncharacterized protein LOC100274183 [Zea mays]